MSGSGQGVNLGDNFRWWTPDTVNGMSAVPMFVQTYVTPPLFLPFWKLLVAHFIEWCVLKVDNIDLYECE
eukprot:c44055_g1_i1 orf=183-392(+)